MKKSLVSLLLLMSIFVLSTATAAENTVSRLPGHYNLEGVSEVGSELILKENGKFKWMLSYGSVDRQVQGDWHVEDNEVTLASDPTEQKVEFRILDEAESDFRKDVAKGIWVASIGVKEVGPIGGMEARFKAESGKVATAVSLENGDAIVTMPASETWSRIGLRRHGTVDDFQWIVIPPQRSRERLAAFAVANPETLSGPPFTKLFLIIEKGGLRVTDPRNVLSKGIYARNNLADGSPM